MTIDIDRTYNKVGVGEVVSVRSSQAERARKNGEDLILWCDGEGMTVPNEEIDSSADKERKTYRSNFDSSMTYQLWNYVWRPTLKQAEQPELL